MVWRDDKEGADFKMTMVLKIRKLMPLILLLARLYMLSYLVTTEEIGFLGTNF